MKILNEIILLVSILGIGAALVVLTAIGGEALGVAIEMWMYER